MYQKPVSYTHLDVYKRQYINNGVRTPVSLSAKGKLTVSGNDFSKAADNAYFNCIETGYNGIYEVQNGSRCV